MSVTTLLLTFYLNKAFNLWRDIYDKGTKMKGRINDICMVLGAYHITKLCACIAKKSHGNRLSCVLN